MTLAGIAQQTSPLGRALSFVADLVVLNLLFVATSLPVVTLGASLAALHTTARRMAAGEHPVVTTTYLRALRDSWRQGSLLLLALLGLAVVVGGWGVLAVYLAVPTLVGIGLWMVLVLSGLQLLGTALFAFAYQATFTGGVGEVLRTSRRMSLRHPLATLTLLVLVGAPVVLTVQRPALSAYGLLWFAIGVALVAWVSALVQRRVFVRYAPDLAAQDATA